MIRTVTTAVAVVVALVVAVQGDRVPSFRFNYNADSEPTGGVAQFYTGPTSAFIYNWGYNFPGRAHTESKAIDGTVQGSYAFVDANGEVQQAIYRASPGSGFNVEQSAVPTANAINVVYPELGSPLFASGGDVQPVKPTVQAEVNPSDGNIAQNVYNSLAQRGVGLDIGSIQAIESASPTLLAAVRSGLLEPLRGNKHELVFKVSDSLVNDAFGSVSALAHILDADTVSARHDQQVPRTQATFYNFPIDDEPSANRAVLEIDVSDGPGYIVRVPYRN